MSKTRKPRALGRAILEVKWKREIAKHVLLWATVTVAIEFCRYMVEQYTARL